MQASNEKGKQTEDFDYLVTQPTGRPLYDQCEFEDDNEKVKF